MEFLYPNILYGLLAVAIPILVHLFNFRRYRKVYFSNVQMLQSIHKKTKKQSELKHLIILLTRILVIIAVVLAFAQPIIPNKQSNIAKQEHQYVSIYLDNSFSMTHIGESGTLLNEAQNMALSILDSYQNSDYFHLITNDMFGHHHRWFNKMEMTQNMMEVQAVHIQQSLHDVLQRESMLRKQNQQIPANKKAVLYLLSDFQKNIEFSPKMAADTNLLVRMIPLQNNPVNNISIDSLWFEYPVQLPHTVSVVHIKVSNNGTEKQTNIPLRLFIDKEQKSVVSVDLEANKSQIFELSFTNKTKGEFQGHVELDDYPIIFDDRFYFTFRVRDLFKASMIYQQNPNTYLNHLFNHDSLIQWAMYPLNAVNYQEMNQQDLIILNELEELNSGLQKKLNQFLEKGGQVLIIPPDGDHIDDINNWLKEINAPIYSSLDTVAIRMNKIDKQLAFYDRVFEKQLKKSSDNQKIDLPLIKKYFPVLTGPGSNKLLITQGGNTLLASSEIGLGKLFQLAMPLSVEYSQLPEHALFVAIFYQMVIQSQDQKSLYETIGSGKAIDITLSKQTDDATDEILHIKKGEIDWIPEIKRINKNEFLLLNMQWPEEGIYDIEFQKQRIERLAINFNRDESNFSIWSHDELMKQIVDFNLLNFQILNTSTQKVSSQIIQLDHGISLWKWFVVLAILFIFAETIILRLWK